MMLAHARQSIAYQGVLLAAVSALTATALALANTYTAPAIRQAQAQELESSLRQVLPAGFNDNDLLADSAQIRDAQGHNLPLYKARKRGLLRGAVLQTSAAGYAGPIVIIVGISREGVVQGVRVLRHAETPGLGDKIDVAKSDWVHAFTGKSLTGTRWLVRKDGGDFDQFAGATITPRSVVKAVKQVLDLHQARHAEIYTDK